MSDSALAVEDAAMDVAMMEGEPEVMDAEVPTVDVPSVALSGSAKMGLKRVDDNTSKDPESDNVVTVVEYEVKFSSSGVTDGGLVFGAAISIDEDGKGDAMKNGVNAASAYIGGADGSWTLQFGSNDPGIDLVGNVGLADADEISSMTKTVVPIEYKLSDGTMMRLRGYTTAPATYSGVSGVGTLETLADPDRVRDKRADLDAAGKMPAGFYDAQSRPLSGIKQKTGGIDYGLSVDGTALNWKLRGTSMPAPPPGRTDLSLAGRMGSFSYALTAGDDGSDAWSIGTAYEAGVVSIGLGMDSNKVMAVGLGGTFADTDVKATWVQQDKAETYYSLISIVNTNDNTGLILLATDVTVNDMEAMGLSVGRAIGSGTNVTLTWSQRKDKGLATSDFVGTKRWEIDVTHDLGGGAKFYAGIEQDRRSAFNNRYDVTIPTITEPTVPTYKPIIKKSKVTTIEAGITMAF